MDDRQKKLIGTKIKQIRSNLGLSMDSFGELLSPIASKGTISKWEKGIYLPNNTRLQQIAKLGNISLPYLLYGGLIEEAKRTLKNQIKFYSNNIPKGEVIVNYREIVIVNNEPKFLDEICDYSKDILKVCRRNLTILETIENDIKEGKSIEGLTVILEELTDISTVARKTRNGILFSTNKNTNYIGKIPKNRNSPAIIELEKIFNSKKTLTLNGKVLSEAEKQKALQLLKITFE